MAMVPSTASVMSTWVSTCPEVTSKHSSTSAGVPASASVPSVATSTARCASAGVAHWNTARQAPAQPRACC